MVCKKRKQITLMVLEQKHIRKEWQYDFEAAGFQSFCEALAGDMKKLGIQLSLARNRDAVVTVNSYADLLNVVKISSPADGHVNHCVGHIIGKSEKLDILQDIDTAVRRVAFAPETIAPADEFRRVCHNCGCGC